MMRARIMLKLVRRERRQDNGRQEDMTVVVRQPSSGCEGVSGL